jgi:four helix bundle protein
MLRIYEVSLEMVAAVAGAAETIGVSDRDLARQLRRSSVSVALNLAEGSAVRDGRRRVRYGDALGSALETRAGIEVAVAVGYLDSMPGKLQSNFRHIIGVLYKLT